MKTYFTLFATIPFIISGIYAQSHENQTSKDPQVYGCGNHKGTSKETPISKEELLGQDNYGDIRTHYKVLVHTQKYGYMLAQLVRDLKYFINQIDFNFIEFEGQREDIGKRLARLQLSISNEDTCGSVIKKLQFAVKTFAAMNRSVRLAKLIKISAERNSSTMSIYRPIYEISEVNVIALALCEPDGTLRVSGKEKNENISRLRRRLRFWKEEFKELVYVSSNVHLMLESQVRQTSKTLEFLENSILNTSKKRISGFT